MRSLRGLSALLLILSALPPAPAAAETAVPQSQAEIALSFAPVVQATAPAVVNIYARQVVQDRVNPFAGDIAELQLPLDAQGVVLLQAEDIAREVGLLPGDILIGLNGVPVTTPDEALALAREPVRRWQIDLLRGGQALRLRFRL